MLDSRAFAYFMEPNWGIVLERSMIEHHCLSCLEDATLLLEVTHKNAVFEP